MTIDRDSEMSKCPGTGSGAARLRDRVGIITGAASGIGRASALRFAAEGARLILADRADAVDETAAMVAAAGGDARAVVMDAGDEDAVADLVGTAIAHHGQLDFAFANAGVGGGMAGVFDEDAAAFAEVLRVNLIGPWAMVKHAGRAMMDRGKGGAILLTASVAGLRSGAGGPAYSASKAGVINLAMVSAQQLSDTGVRVNALCPGLTETGMTRFVFDHARARGSQDRIGRLNPLRRAAHADELASVALFLLSDEASYVNGQAIAVDGGLSSSHPVTRQLTGQTAV